MGEVLNLGATNEQNNASNRSGLRFVRAHVVEVRKDATGKVEIKGGGMPRPSEVLVEEPFSALQQAGRIIEPPFDLLTLAMLTEHSSELGQCIDAMEINIEGYGYRFVSRLKTGPSVPASPEAQAARVEFAKLSNFFTYCTRDSFVGFRRKLREDLEQTGNGYYEVLRDTDENIIGFTHIPSYQMRLGRSDDESMLVDRKILELQPDGSITVGKCKEWRRFRRYVQSRALYRSTLHTIEGYKVRWFKEFGDPRPLSKTTGEFETAQTPVPSSDRATEIIHIALYSARSPYGIPRYIGNLLSIFGDRAAEEINYITFRNNNIPSMVVSVSNGQLTAGTIERIQSFVESQIQGSDNYSKFLIIEAEPFGDEGEDGNQTKIDVQPLVKDQHKDALFQNYSANNQEKIRRAFRLPALFVGKSEGYNRATAEADRKLADEQVFGPERDGFDEVVNRLIFPDMGVIYHKFKTNSPNTTDNSQLVKILGGSEKSGGMTPRIARSVLSEVLNQEFPEFPDEFKADLPFSLSMAEAVKNKADASEPGQQVTALKALQVLGILGDDQTADDEPSEELELVVKKIADMVRKDLGREVGD